MNHWVIAGVVWTIAQVVCVVFLVALSWYIFYTDHKRRLAEMGREHQAVMERMDADHQRRMAEIRRNHERRMARLGPFREPANPWLEPATRNVAAGLQTEADRLFRRLERQGLTVIHDEEGREYTLTPNGWVEANAHRQEAERRAAELLRRSLTEQQRRQLDYAGDFDVFITYSGARRRFVVFGHGGQVREVDSNRRTIASYCIRPAANQDVPRADIALAQKLLLETDPATFFATANKTSL